MDSRQCFLSHDNITALIGQNESGKTSVLEALKSFYEGQITDDVLRSDQTFPEITCLFELDEERIQDMISFDRLTPDLREILAEKREIGLCRKWLNARRNVVTIAESEVLEYFNRQEEIKTKADVRISEAFEKLGSRSDSLLRSIAEHEQQVAQYRLQLNQTASKLDNTRRIQSKTRKPDEQITLETELSQLEKQTAELQDSLRLGLNQLEDLKSQIDAVSLQFRHCSNFLSLIKQLSDTGRELEIKGRLVTDTEHQLELCSSEREKRLLAKKLDQLKSLHDQLIKAQKDLSDSIQLERLVTDKLLDGHNLMEAEAAARNEIELTGELYTPEEMGMHLFLHIPLFEFFEDFSSLLPNKIDLEDLLNDNSQAEGYKAARNFLSIAGLHAEFFREKNHRILKQKIENLNSEITIDFQDYWRQNLGKDDKIRIHFELEHYDYTVPEKSGKPYLEFWIKDRLERLYPKQRSRGVRWFLSFYLELKATAKENHVNRVLLIDEPGLSLHARAQEDVLKVFEDLRETLQIVYCTHSPHLIDLGKLYRLLAVQRANEHDEKSETVVLDARSFHSASTDTLSPIYSLMGARLNEQQFIYPKNNIIVEDTVNYFYLSALARLLGQEGMIHFIPANGLESLPHMCNLLFGWKIEFGLLVFDTPRNRQAAANLENTLFPGFAGTDLQKTAVVDHVTAIEDLFSTLDFKRLILQQRVGITEKNSEFIQENNLSRILLATGFNSRVQRGMISKEAFDDESTAAVLKVFAMVNNLVKQ